MRNLSPRARWAVPAVVGAAVAAAFIAPPLVASASSKDLPAITPQELVTSVAEAENVALAGTVVYTARLGLPSLPLGDMAGASPVNLLDGSSTMRVWTDGIDRSRAALLGAASEFSVVHDGPEAWTYSSTDDAVVHYTIDPKDQARLQELQEQPRVSGDLPTPAAAAASALSMVEQFSTVSLDAQSRVAGRDAYTLVVTPKSRTTLVGHVVIAVDATTKTPLRVQVWDRTSKSAALEVGFTDIRFDTPSDSVLSFSAPAGATTKDVTVPLPAPTDKPATPQALPDGTTVTGTGWDTVVQVAGVDVAGLLAGDADALASVAPTKPAIGSKSGQALLDEFGADGTDKVKDLDLDTLFNQVTKQVAEGRLVTTKLASVLVTDDGRVLVGAVPGATLQALAR
jgi:outer membrane lipoprotein-sorting protein